MLDAHASKEKVKRAKQHIEDLVVLLENFASAQLYSVSVEQCTWQSTQEWMRDELVITINPDTPFRTEAALIIGDAVHNLRSALDLLYYRLVTEVCCGVPTKWTRFPITDTRDELKAPINGALKQQQITSEVASFILDVVKPYEAGNRFLWALHELNIRDKHKLLIPTFKVVCISHICLRNDDKILSYNPIFTTESCRKRLDEMVYGRSPTVEDKGHATTGIGFDFGTPFDGESVFPALNGIAEEVTRTIEAFEVLFRDR